MHSLGAVRKWRGYGQPERLCSVNQIRQVPSGPQTYHEIKSQTKSVGSDGRIDSPSSWAGIGARLVRPASTCCELQRVALGRRFSPEFPSSAFN